MIEMIVAGALLLGSGSGVGNAVLRTVASLQRLVIPTYGVRFVEAAEGKEVTPRRNVGCGESPIAIEDVTIVGNSEQAILIAVSTSPGFFPDAEVVVRSQGCAFSVSAATPSPNAGGGRFVYEAAVALPSGFNRCEITAVASAMSTTDVLVTDIRNFAIVEEQGVVVVIDPVALDFSSWDSVSSWHIGLNGSIVADEFIGKTAPYSEEKTLPIVNSITKSFNAEESK